MIILGIDPGLATLGYGLIELKERNGYAALDCGVISTPASMSLPERLLALSEGIEALIGRYGPQAVAVEELFFAKNEKTAIVVGQARGVVLVTCARAGCGLYEYTPLQVKQAVVGYGRADKNQVQQMVRVLLKLKDAPKPDDAADALAIALCHAHSLGARAQFRIR